MRYVGGCAMEHSQSLVDQGCEWTLHTEQDKAASAELEVVTGTSLFKDQASSQPCILYQDYVKMFMVCQGGKVSLLRIRNYKLILRRIWQDSHYLCGPNIQLIFKIALGFPPTHRA